ncbi:MAG: beta-ketoacyl synthase N-terminal-like domain-containing protein, partial [Actinomycetota bacterium]|nr:beta-ketoacyl synthase N-terminal-like domain-containing protein [Actinomycetota bacterium]
MREAVVCDPLRTAVGGFGGVLRDVPAAELAATVVKALVDRSGIPADRIDDVVFAQGYANGEAPAIGRVAALDAGLPVTVPGLQIDRRCGSGLQAVAYAAMQVQTGVSEVVVAGGAESMSQAEYYSTATRWGARAGDVG